MTRVEKVLVAGVYALLGFVVAHAFVGCGGRLRVADCGDAGVVCSPPEATSEAQVYCCPEAYACCSGGCCPVVEASDSYSSVR